MKEALNHQRWVLLENGKDSQVCKCQEKQTTLREKEEWWVVGKW